MVLFAGTLTALLLFLMDLRAGHRWLLLLTAAAAAAFAVRELRVADPSSTCGCSAATAR